MELKLKNNSKLKIQTFTRLEYIKSNGTQYIDTGVLQSTIKKYELVWMGDGINIPTLGGKSGGWGFNDSLLSYLYSGGAIYYSSGNGSFVRVNGTTGVKYTEIYNNGTLSVNGQTGNIGTLKKNINLTIFYGGGKYGNGKIYSMKIYDQSMNLIRDFLPVKDSSEVVCLYDNVSKKYFYNQGTGDFVAGPIVENNYQIPNTVVASITSIFHQNTPNSGFEFIKDVLNYQKTHQEGVILLNRIRADIGNVEGPLPDLMELAGMAGFNDNYEPQAKPRLVGTYTVTDYITQAVASFLQSNCPDGMTLIMPNIVSPSDCLIQSFDKDGVNYNPGVCVVLYRNRSYVNRVYNIDGSIGIAILLDSISNNTSFNFDFYSDGNFHGFANVTDNDGVCVESYTDGVFSPRTYDITTLSFLGNLPSNIKTLVVGLSNYTKVTDSVIKIAPHATEINFRGLTSFIRNSTRYVFEIGENVTKITNYNDYYGQSKSICHLLAETPPTMTSMYGIHPTCVGDGSSAEHDDAILQAYLAVSPWSGYASMLKTWYSYLHPSA